MPLLAQCRRAFLGLVGALLLVFVSGCMNNTEIPLVEFPKGAPPPPPPAKNAAPPQGAATSQGEPAH